MLTVPRTLCAVLGVLAGCDRGPPPGSPAALAIELRDLGIPQQAMSEDFRIMTAGQLDEGQLGRMPRFGFETVISLRDAKEQGTGWEEVFAKRNGITFARMPIRGATDMTREKALEIDAAIAAAKGPVVLMCGSSDRVGGVMALRAHFAKGVTPDEALAIGKHHGMRKTEATVRKRLER